MGATGLRLGVRPIPSLDTAWARSLSGCCGDARPPPPPGAAAARSVTTTAAHPVNIRSHPRGGGTVVRTVPRASVLRVFGEAPGGWFQVGGDRPFGWVHGSVLKQ